MRRALLLLSAVLPVAAQDAMTVRGEKVFATSCSVPYCHGPNGTAGRAPKLAGHSFTARQLSSTISNGIPNKGMPAFGDQLSADEVGAVVSYVMTLKGSAPPAATAAVSARKMPAEAQAGREQFFDAVRMGGCGRCHELEKRGSPVATDLMTVAAPVDLRSIAVRHIVTALPVGDAAFPAFVIERSEKRVRIFDLSSPLPVLRTFTADAVKLTDGATWQHADAIHDYNDRELRQITAYLQWVVAAK
jgi:mono/diheme cytochrome c family protein